MEKLTLSEQVRLIKRGTVEIISETDLRSRLEESQKNKRPLNIKAGFDPTAADIHLGHTVILRKLRTFQELGHKVFFLIGDFTAQIGDPSGRDRARPKITKEEINRNAATYKRQIFKILDANKTEVVFNSSWFTKMNLQRVLELSSFVTVAQLLARADFRQRFDQKKEISLLEFLYPVLQAYDSVKIKADVELGGTDQKFNLLMGRQIQIACGQQPQVVIMTPLLEGIDGVEKMSKSQENYIGIDESPDEIFGKTMSISDELMYKYYELLTAVDLEKIKRFPPKEAKIRLAKLFVEQFYGKEIANKSEKEFVRVFSKRQLPSDISIYEFKKSTNITEILVKNKFASSRNEARRLVRQGAVSINGNKIDNINFVVKEGGILKVGKRRFLKIVKV
jgi:tyrosyl-tRNA synthetase